MLVNVKITYGPTITDGSFNPSASYTGQAFNTETLQMQAISGYWRGALLDTRPPNVYYNSGDVIHWVCPEDPTDHTAIVYRFLRAKDSITGTDTYGTGIEENSFFCGYIPPDTRTCLIGISDIHVTESSATIFLEDTIGPVEYSLNGGATRQTSPFFSDLAPGTYEVTAFDLGATLPGCKASDTFVIPEFDATVPPAQIGPLPEFCFAGNPVVLTVTSFRSQHDVVVEVYVETQHSSGTFNLVYTAKRRTGADKIARLDVADVLGGQLEPELHIEAGWHKLTNPIRNWFVRVADVNPATGRPGQWSTSGNSVVLLGGLPPEVLLGGRDYFTTALRKQPYLTWQPTTKRVGRNHLEVVQLLISEVHPYTGVIQAYDAAGVPQTPESFVFPVPPPPGPVGNLVTPPPHSVGQRVHLAQLVILMDDFGGAAVEFTADDAYSSSGRLRIEFNDSNRDEPRQLIFQNSLGGFDTLALFGRMSTKLSAERGSIETYEPLAAGQVATSRQKSWPPTPATTTYALSTGWTSNQWLEYLQELLTPGRQVFEYFGGQLRPIVITTKEIAAYEDGQGHTAAVLEYQAAFRNHYYADYARNTNRTRDAGFAWR